MADKEILNAILRMESQSREDHQLIQVQFKELNTQIRGYASISAANRAQIVTLRDDVDDLCGTVDEHSKAISGIKGQWKVAIAILVPVILAACAVFASKLIGD